MEDFLSQDSVEDRNPFQVDARRRNRRKFLAWQRQLVDRLGIKSLLRRRLVHLSHGELRKTLLTFALLKCPHLLVLEDPYAGLDAAQRRTLLGAVDRVVDQTGARLIFVTHHKDEVPRCVSDVLHLAAGHIRRRATR